MGKYLIVDDVEYPVAVVKLTRKGDVLDKTANRTEDGELHREPIGTYYNYSMEIKPPHSLEPEKMELYDSLFYVLSAPVVSHMVQLPNQSEAQEMYFGSVQDEIIWTDGNGKTLYGNLTCNLVCMRPSRYAGEVR